MTEAVSTSLPAEPGTFVEVWAQCLSQVLGQLAAIPVPCVVLAEAPAEVAARSENDLLLIPTLSGGLRGEMSLRLSPPAVVRCAQIFVGDGAATPAEMTPEHRDAALELIRQVAGLVSTSLESRWGEVQLRIEGAHAMPTWSASATAWLRAGEDSAPVAWVEVYLSAALVAALRAEKKEELPAPEPSTLTSAPDSSANLGLLMDVELAVELRFGSRRLALREVLDLGPGAVVELDRQVQEPVDLLLDGRLLARGEVVVIDGNYAMRVTEVAPQNREMEFR